MARAHLLVVPPPTDQERDALNILLAQLALVLIVRASIRPGNLGLLPNTLTTAHALLKGRHPSKTGTIPSHRSIPPVIAALDLLATTKAMRRDPIIAALGPLATARPMRKALIALPVIAALDPLATARPMRKAPIALLGATLVIMAHAPLTQRDAPTTTSPTVDNEAMPVALIKKVPIPTSVITGTTSSVLNTATALPSKAPSNAVRSVPRASLTSFNEVNAFHATINRTVVPHNLILAIHAGKANKQRIVTTRSATDHRTLMSTPLIKKLNLKETTSVLTMPTISLKSVM
jgi:hypothetical protein